MLSRGLGPPWIRTDRPLVYAHRGVNAEAPENTEAAFALAEIRGADGVELDVVLCATGEAVVFHDETLARMTGAMGLVRETSFSELRRLRAGGERIPLLEEALESTPLLVNVELKCEHAADAFPLVKAAARAITRVHADARVLFSSFHPVALWAAARVAPAIVRGLLFESHAPLPLRAAWAAPLASAVHPQASQCDETSVERWRARGYAVNAWTVNDDADLDRLCQIGVSGLITDRPARAREIAERTKNPVPA